MKNEQKHYVFVYGTLRRGFNNHHLLNGSKFIGDAKTKEKYKLTAELIPFVTKDEKLCNVIGEVYEVDDRTLERLDTLEGHPNVYRRELIPVILNDNREIEAWIYFFMHSVEGLILIRSCDYRDHILKNFKRKYPMLF